MVPNSTVDMFAYPCVSHSSNYKSGLFNKTRAGMVKLLHPHVQVWAVTEKYLRFPGHGSNKAG